MKDLNEIEKEIYLEIKKIKKIIKKGKIKNVLLQIPDFLKPYASSIVDRLEESLKDKINFFIWFGSCYGACDIPCLPKNIKIDLLIQFGHTKFSN
ncbi:MAG: diphthamide synthesis protein [Candidatus Pacearchaeota archaeon]